MGLLQGWDQLGDFGAGGKAARGMEGGKGEEEVRVPALVRGRAVSPAPFTVAVRSRAPGARFTGVTGDGRGVRACIASLRPWQAVDVQFIPQTPRPARSPGSRPPWPRCGSRPPGGCGFPLSLSPESPPLMVPCALAAAPPSWSRGGTCCCLSRLLGGLQALVGLGEEGSPLSSLSSVVSASFIHSTQCLVYSSVAWVYKLFPLFPSKPLTLCACFLSCKG